MLGSQPQAYSLIIKMRHRNKGCFRQIGFVYALLLQRINTDAYW